MRPPETALAQKNYRLAEAMSRRSGAWNAAHERNAEPETERANHSNRKPLVCAVLGTSQCRRNRGIFNKQGGHYADPPVCHRVFEESPLEKPRPTWAENDSRLPRRTISSKSQDKEHFCDFVIERDLVGRTIFLDDFQSRHQERQT
jgi:hypothetical protein